MNWNLKPDTLPSLLFVQLPRLRDAESLTQAFGCVGFLATSAGGAVLASAVGAAGSGLAVPHLSHRIGAAPLMRSFARDSCLHPFKDTKKGVLGPKSKADQPSLSAAVSYLLAPC